MKCHKYVVSQKFKTHLQKLCCSQDTHGYDDKVFRKCVNQLWDPLGPETLTDAIMFLTRYK